MNWKNKRTLSFIFWLVLLVTMVGVQPDLNKLIEEKGNLSLPTDSESEVGAKYLSELNTDGELTYAFALVFNREEGLTDTDFDVIDQVLQDIQQDASISIKDALIHTDSEQAAEQLIAKDGTTVITQLAISKEDGLADEVAGNLREHLKNVDIDTYVTGNDLVISDFATSTQEGVKKTEIITIVFVLTTLILIFRSPVVPFVSLVSVGVSYAISLSIISLLVEHFNMPFSNFTQVFLVVILFGVGTDYNILLFTRFKEELAKQGHVLQAITTTYKTAGKTVIYSGLAVLVGFLALFLAKFSMYQATASVAIGVAVLLAVLLTLNPFFMGLFGMKMFWPIKEIKGHQDNKLWGFLSRFAFMRPFVSLLFILLITVPFILHYSNTLNYNDLVEIDDKYESKQAIAVIEDHYEAGFSAPVSFVLKGEELASADSLAELDGLANAIEQVNGVAKVFSVTRPEGSKIPELYMDHQAGTLQDGLTDANEGVNEISTGLSEAKEEVSKPKDMSGINELIDGTTALGKGASELEQALTQLQTGIQSGANGSEELEQGAQTLATKTEELAKGLQQLTASYGQLASGFSQFSTVFDQSIAGLTGAKQGYEQIEALMKATVTTNNSKEVQTALQIAIGAQAQIDEAVQKLSAAKQQYIALQANFSQANTALEQAASGAAQLKNGAEQLAVGSGSLRAGLSEAANGSAEILNASKQLPTGLNEVNAGQQQLKEGLEVLQEQMQTLADGLQQSTDGLDEIYEGLDDANVYLDDLHQQNDAQFFIPQEVLASEEFKESLLTYMNEDGTLTSMNIILEINPYTEEAMTIVEEIQQVKENYLATSSLQDSESYLSGRTMSTIDLQSISKGDFIRSATVMMIGILCILLWVTRSVFQTVIIIGSLILTNFAALGISELFVQNVLGHEMLSWNVPFFTLSMIVTLGVDYSIFVMMRYNESKEQGLSQILPTTKEMGGVILSAAVILGGTFAAMIPSGIITLMQVSISVMIGLVLLSLFIMPILIPACFGLIEKFKNKKQNK